MLFRSDLPGGASSFILNKIFQDKNGYEFLDSKPFALTSKEHRPAYGTDGDYFSKPSSDDIVELAYKIMNEYDPGKYPELI